MPAVQARYRGTAQPRTDDFVSGPLRIEKHARGVILCDFIVASGDLFEDAEAYRARNLIPVDDGRISVADEELGKYSPVVFAEGVARVVSEFAKGAVTEIVDVPLVELLRSRT